METAVTMVTACLLSLYLVCVTVQERVCVSILYLYAQYVFDGSLGLCRQTGSYSLIPPLKILRLLKLICDLLSYIWTFPGAPD